MERARFALPWLLTMASAFTASTLAARAARGGDWPAWRGPGGQGICDESALPTRFDATTNVRWKLALPDRGNSTPIVVGTRVFLTQATEGGKQRALWCVDRKKGELRWTRSVEFAGDEPTHETNPYCSASPASDGERVVVSHGSAGVFCYDLGGKELWRRELGGLRHIWGNAASPVIWKDLVFINHGPGPNTRLYALRKTDGETVWRVEIPGGDEGQGGSSTWTGSWSTPLVVEEAARATLLIGYPDRLLALDAKSGKEIWSCAGLGRLVYTSPITGAGIVVAMSGFMGPALAVRLGGEGDVTATHRIWRHEREQQHVGSGVVVGGSVFVHNDSGALECRDLESGELRWRERLGSRSWSSLVAAGDRLWALDDQGTCFVLRASTTFEKLAENQLGEPTRASIAASDGELFIRTYKHLWSVSERGST